jgi:hypothetical protein
VDIKKEEYGIYKGFFWVVGGLGGGGVFRLKGSNQELIHFYIFRAFELLSF